MKTYLMAVALLLMSCHKKEVVQPEEVAAPEQVPDTIKPRSYFPAVPGSYWKYIVDDSIITVDSVANEYQLTSWLNGKAFLPFYHGTVGYWASNGAFIGGYDRGCLGFTPLSASFPPYRISGFLSEGKDSLDMTLPCDSRYGCIHEKSAVHEKTIDSQNDSIIILKGYYYLSQPSSTDKSPRDERTYHKYKKNVGLTFECVTSVKTGDTIFTRKLIEYRIGK